MQRPEKLFIGVNFSGFEAKPRRCELADVLCLPRLASGVASAVQCNIDARGKAVRLTMGLASLLAAVVLGTAIAAGWLPGGLLWLAVVAAALGGAFAVFEGWAGWCAVRALGFKTPV